MLALQYRRSIPSYAIVRASGGRPEVATSALSMLKLGDVPEPELPTREWVRVITEQDAYVAPVAVVTAGAWAGPLLFGHVELPLLTTTCERVAFFELDGSGAMPSTQAAA